MQNSKFKEWEILRSGKSADFALIAGITLLLLAIISMNVNLIFKMTSNQTEEIGRMQLESIRIDLEGKIISSENATTQIASEAENLLDGKISQEDLTKFFYQKKKEQYALTDGVCFNTYIANKKFTIIPDFDMPESYHAPERLWYLGAAENPGKVYITEPYIDAAGNGICFTMSTMLSDNETVVALDFNFLDMQRSISQMTAGSNRTALIVSKNGMIMGYTDMSLVGERISKKLPDYEKILQRVVDNPTHESFSAQLNGSSCTIFSSETSNGWYMILSVEDWTLYQDSYRQMIITIVVSLVMILAIIAFYFNGVKNRLQTEKALRAKEEFLSSLSTELREPLKKILRISNIETFESNKPAEISAQIKESALQLSDMLDNLFSFSKIVEINSADDEKNNRSLELSKASRFARTGIVSILIVATTLSMALCVYTTINWGDTKMKGEVTNYEYQLSTWTERHKSILSMFVNIVAEHPELMNDYNSAVRMLNDVAKNYPEISVCYIANPYLEHQIIMNNGWESPDENWRVDQRQWYIDTEKSLDGFNISAPYYDDQTGVYCVTLSQIVYGRNGEFLGIFAIDFFLDKLIHILDESYTKDTYAFLVDKNGIILNHPNAFYQMSIDMMMSVKSTEYREVFAENGKVFMLKDYRGKNVACYSQKDKSSNFTIIVANDWWDIYGNIFALGIFFIFLLITCISSVTTLINRQLKWQQSANRKLREAANEAIAAGQAKFQFLAQMSHEIRTPMNAVLGMNELILRESKDKNISEYAENIQNAGKTLLSLINSILDFSKIENGKMSIVPVRYDTAAAINDLTNMTIERTKKKGLEFLLDIDPNLPRLLYGDDMRIKQIITNLLTNAVKYTHKGSVKFSVKIISIDSDSLEIEVKVSDTGIGIRAEDIDKLFLSFRRLDEEKNRHIEGTGLGISIVQKLLSMMGSKLEVSSEYGKGSTFSFRLEQKIIDRAPIGDCDGREQDRHEDKKNKTFLKAKGAKILVVDDNHMNLKVVAGLLKFNEITPDLASSGQQCLKLVAENNYHIIFLDHMMPEMDGIETLKIIKADHLADNSTIIALTANAISGAQEFYINEGFDAYLSKPVNPDDLEKTLKKFLPENILNHDAEKIPDEEIIADEKNIPAPEIPIEEIPAEEEDDDTFSSAEREQLEKICAGIDVDTAMNYCMDSKEFFIEMLREFYANDKTESASKLFAEDDFKNYRILVHALKSTSLVIGAQIFSEKAKAQELAAKDGNIDFVKQNHADFMEDYEKLRADIGKWLEVSGNAKNSDS